MNVDLFFDLFMHTNSFVYLYALPTYRYLECVDDKYLKQFQPSKYVARILSSYVTRCQKRGRLFRPNFLSRFKLDLEHVWVLKIQTTCNSQLPCFEFLRTDKWYNVLRVFQGARKIRSDNLSS